MHTVKQKYLVILSDEVNRHTNTRASSRTKKITKTKPNTYNHSLGKKDKI